jgi:hypothetical protein
MPRLVAYDVVLHSMQSLGLRCVYHNSGAFAFDRSAGSHVVGWVGPDDATIRADLTPHVVRVGPPYEGSLAHKFTDVWTTHLPGPAWVVPKAHWAHELDPAHGAWLAKTLSSLGIDPEPLRGVARAHAIEFQMDESDGLSRLLVDLLTHLHLSDFAVLFPQRPALVTVHHHKQLWWQVDEREVDSGLFDAIRA